MQKVYLDYNATTPLRDEVRADLIDSLSLFGNASSMHTEGREARGRLEEARRAVAQLVGADAGEIVFTSGGSESNNTVFQTVRDLVDGPGRARAGGRSEIVTTTIEHPCVLNSAKYLESLGCKVTFVPVDGDGKLKMDAFAAALNERTLLVSVMYANNEIGVVQDMAEICRLAKEAGALMHSDAVQAAGKIPLDTAALPVDYLTLSCHKIYGPKGVGALYRRAGAPLFPLIHGGHQEAGLRAGTYNNLGVFAFGTAAECARTGLDAYREKTWALRERLREGLCAAVPDIKLNGHPRDVLPNTLNVSFPGAEGESILLALDLQGIEVSTGSACASGSLEPSHVLLAIGVAPDFAHGSVRFSLGLNTSAEEIDYVIETLPPIIARLRAMSSAPRAARA